jgi:hemerythrin-like domain-containing protein
MTELIQVLRREHANMATLVKSLEWQLAEFERGETPDYDVIRGVTDYFLSFPDMYHHPKEDMVFARLLQRDPAAAERVGDLRREHERLAARTREFANGINAVLDEAQVPRESLLRWGREFIDLQRRHMQMEEILFLPAAERALTVEDWTALEQMMTAEDDPLFGPSVGEHFDSLRQKILSWQQEYEKL